MHAALVGATNMVDVENVKSSILSCRKPIDIVAESSVQMFRTATRFKHFKLMTYTVLNSWTQGILASFHFRFHIVTSPRCQHRMCRAKQQQSLVSHWLMFKIVATGIPNEMRMRMKTAMEMEMESILREKDIWLVSLSRLIQWCTLHTNENRMTWKIHRNVKWCWLLANKRIKYLSHCT